MLKINSKNLDGHRLHPYVDENLESLDLEWFHAFWLSLWFGTCIFSARREQYGSKASLRGNCKIFIWKKSISIFFCKKKKKIEEFDYYKDRPEDMRPERLIDKEDKF